jgi:predicted N-formylglutamate amidohydrolase
MPACSTIAIRASPAAFWRCSTGREFVVGDNEPYFVSDTSDYTIPVHAERRGLHHVLIEIRQDLIAEETGQRDWAARLARLLPEAYRGLENQR